MFQMTDDGVNWQEVDEERAIEVLSKTYPGYDEGESPINSILTYMKEKGYLAQSAVGTFYRWVEPEETQ